MKSSRFSLILSIFGIATPQKMMTESYQTIEKAIEASVQDKNVLKLQVGYIC